MKSSDNPTNNFIKTWAKFLEKIFARFRDEKPTNQELARVVAEIGISLHQNSQISEEQKVLLEVFEDIDNYNALLEEAKKCEDQEQWFENKVEDFARQVIPDADDADIREVKKMVSEAFDKEIEARGNAMREMTDNSK